MATVGKSIDPVKKAVNAIPGIDVIILFYSETYSTEADILKHILSETIPDVRLCSIKPFDFQDISSKIIETLKDIEFRRPTLSMNITGGTNLMAAAACSTAFFIGAKIYYVLQDDTKPISQQLVEIPMPKVPNMDNIKGTTLKILHYVADCGETGTRSVDIAHTFSISPQSVPYQVNKLVGEGLVTFESGMFRNGKWNSREKCVKITNQGLIISKWTA